MRNAEGRLNGECGMRNSLESPDPPPLRAFVPEPAPARRGPFVASSLYAPLPYGRGSALRDVCGSTPLNWTQMPDRFLTGAARIEGRFLTGAVRPCATYGAAHHLSARKCLTASLRARLGSRVASSRARLGSNAPVNAYAQLAFSVSSFVVFGWVGRWSGRRGGAWCFLSGSGAFFARLWRL